MFSFRKSTVDQAKESLSNDEPTSREALEHQLR